MDRIGKGCERKDSEVRSSVVQRRLAQFSFVFQIVAGRGYIYHILSISRIYEHDAAVRRSVEKAGSRSWYAVGLLFSGNRCCDPDRGDGIPGLELKTSFQLFSAGLHIV